MESGNPQVLYAGMWRALRTPYSIESGGAGSGLWKSTDGGDTWTNLTSKKGLPRGVWGIVGVAQAPSNPDKVYTLIESQTGGMYMSSDGGENWTLTVTITTSGNVHGTTVKYLSIPKMRIRYMHPM